MTTDAHQIRAEIAGLLAHLPDTTDLGEVDIDALAARLEEAHEMLVSALESVEKG